MCGHACVCGGSVVGVLCTRMQDIESLRANVSVLEQRVMKLQSSTSTTVAPTGEPVAPTGEPVAPTGELGMAVFEDIQVVNFSECTIANGSCKVVSAGCSINFQQMVPEVSCMLCVPTLCGGSPHSSPLAHVVVPECISV